MDGRGTGLCPYHRDTSRDSCFSSCGAIATLTEVLDDGGLHGKFDPVKRDEPDDVLHFKVFPQYLVSMEHGSGRTQTQTMPIHPPEIGLSLVKPQSP